MQNLCWSGFLLCLSFAVVGAEFRHPSGVSFSYPEDWRVQELEDSLMLIPKSGPPSPLISSQPPERFIWVGAEPVSAGIPVDHPDIAAYFDSAVAGVYPSAKRQEQSYPDANVGMLRFTGGAARWIDVRYRLENGLVLFMAHSSSENVSDDVFERAFASFRARLGLDPDLVGTWYRSEMSMTDVNYDSTVDGASYASTASQHRYRFLPDNRFEYTSAAQVYGQSETSAGGGYASSSGENPQDGGTYSASGTTLTLAWDESGVVECAYSVFLNHRQEPALKLQCGETPKFYAFER